MGHPDVAGGPVDRLEVHRPDREHPQPRHVAVHPDAGLPVRRCLQQERAAVRGAAVEVPEVGEGALEVPDARAGHPHVRVAPLGRVGRPDVVAADEAHRVVDDQDLAVVAAVAAQVEEAPAGRVEGVLQHLHARPEPLEARVHDQVGEAVVDREDVDTAGSRVGQRLLEPLADLVALPDVGLEEDLGPGALDGTDHVVVQVLAVGVARDRALAHGDLGRRGDRERLGLLAAPAVGVDQGEDQRHRHLEPEEPQEGTPDRGADARGGRLDPHVRQSIQTVHDLGGGVCRSARLVSFV